MMELEKIKVIAINTGFGFTKCMIAQGRKQWQYYTMPSALAYPDGQDIQEEEIHQNFLIKYGLLFGEDAIASRNPSIPKLTDRADVLYFEEGARFLNERMKAKIFGPMAIGLHEFYPDETEHEMILTLCIPPDHIQYKKAIAADVVGEHTICLQGRTDLKVNVVKCFVLAETYAGLTSQELRYVGPGLPIKQNKEFLTQTTIVINAGCYTFDVTAFYPRTDLHGIRKLKSGHPQSRRWGNWSLLPQIKSHILQKYNDRIMNLSDWQLMEILEKKEIPGKLPVKLAKEFREFFEQRSHAIIDLISQVAEQYPSTHRILLVGGGWHDYKEFILDAPEFKHIPVIEIGKGKDDDDMHPEECVPYGMFTYTRRYYDVLVEQQ